MKKQGRWLVRLLLLLFVIAGGVLQVRQRAYAAAAGKQFEVDYLKYEELTEPSGTEYGSVMLYGYAEGLGTECTIPGTVTWNGKTYSVVEIGEGAFANASLTRVTISGYVERIGYNAFENNQLTSVTFNKGQLREIAGSAFHNNKLTSIEIPDTVTDIGEYAFYNNALASVTIPAGVRTIGELAFTQIDGTYTVLYDALSLEERAFHANAFLAFYDIRMIINLLVTPQITTPNLGGTGIWKAVGVAGDYKVCYYKADGTPVGSAITVTQNSIEHAKYLTEPGSYYFTVQACSATYMPSSAMQSAVFEFTDTAAPVLTDGAAERTGESAAQVTFNCSEAGSIYYAVSAEENAALPDTAGTGTACSAGVQVITLSNITTAAQYVYIKVKDAAGNVSEALKLSIPEWEQTHFTITASAEGFGTISPESVQVERGADMTFTMTPKMGFKIDTVTVDGTDVTAQVVNDTYTFAEVWQDHAIKVTFARNYVTLAKWNELAEVPWGLQETKFNTIDKIKSELGRIAAGVPGYSSGNMSFFDVKPVVGLADGQSFEVEEEEDFLTYFGTGGYPLTSPYPAGTSAATHDFILVHMSSMTSDRLGTVAGSVEILTAEKLEDCLSVKVKGMSPIAIAWKEIKNEETTEVPTTEIPTTEVPTTEAPTTEAPTTEAPTTEVPTTEVPTTEAPMTEAPTTEAPTTEAPTTEVPTTEAPTTEAPTTVPTAAPTAAPTVESTAALSPENQTVNPPPTGDDNQIGWWIGMIAAAFAGIIVVMTAYLRKQEEEK